jgi:hypothetical protein
VVSSSGQLTHSLFQRHHQQKREQMQDWAKSQIIITLVKHKLWTAYDLFSFWKDFKDVGLFNASFQQIFQMFNKLVDELGGHLQAYDQTGISNIINVANEI